eukprot:5665753-Lingulodinium_polyedra.AAC.1
MVAVDGGGRAAPPGADPGSANLVCAGRAPTQRGPGEDERYAVIAEAQGVVQQICMLRAAGQGVFLPRAPLRG